MNTIPNLFRLIILIPTVIFAVIATVVGYPLTRDEWRDLLWPRPRRRHRRPAPASCRRRLTSRNEAY